MSPDPAALQALAGLAELRGIEARYVDATGVRRAAPPAAVLALLQALGEPVQDASEAPAVAAGYVRRQWLRGPDPVAVAWEGEPGHVLLRLAPARADLPAACTLAFEAGEARAWVEELGQVPAALGAEVDGEVWVGKRLPLPPALPRGYHRLEVDVGGQRSQVHVLAAPRLAPAPPPGQARAWGAFLPLHALHDEATWGVGDLRALGALHAWVDGLGGAFVGTLPLLAAFLDEPFEPSPYAPVSRLFWNEVFLDLTGPPEAAAPGVQAVVGSAAFTEALAALREAPLVDYRAAMALKRQALEAMRAALPGDPARSAAFAAWAGAHPEARDYARFRAATERHGAFQGWPERLRRGQLTDADVGPEALEHHLYAQWLLHEQFAALAAQTRRRGLGLYLDLPLGVHGAGYDAWRHPALFAPGVSVGAPADAFFTKGQDWGFAPLHPDRSREEGHDYFARCVRTQLARAGILRLDHILGLHRLFWIPRGFSAAEGAYVRYPAEEFYAVLSIEAHRAGALVVGEDLGTVPPYVRPALDAHGLHRMHVLQIEAFDPAGPLAPAPVNSLASLNTHDMPTFASFWEGRDIAEREDRGLLDGDGAAEERRQRAALRGRLEQALRQEGRLRAPGPDLRAVLDALLAHLAAGPARLLAVNLEDLWLETQPQNRPGEAGGESWRRKARWSLEMFRAAAPVVESLRAVDQLRRSRAPP